jgi:undecaprenyl-diphosphatase
MTIGIALLLGVSKKNASKFSFFIAIPIIIGATLLELIKVENIFSIGLVNLAIGFVVAGISGYLSINWLIKLIDKSHFWKFSFYLWIVSFIIYYV